MTGRTSARLTGAGATVVTVAVLVAQALGGPSQTAAAARTAAGGTGTAAGTGTTAAAASLTSTLDGILADARVSGAARRVVVKDAVSGAVLYSRNGGLRGVPASNEKLYTSAAAMDLLGPSFRFTTTVHRSGRLSGGRLSGNLYLRGTGDPTLLAAHLDRLAADVRTNGVTSVSGYLGVDDTWFDAVRLGPAWAWDNEPYAFSPQISALTLAPDRDLQAGAVAVTVRPKARGARPSVTFSPASGRLVVDNRARTGAPGTARTLRVVRAHGSNRFVVTGSVPAGGAASVTKASVQDPAMVAADVFRRALARHGVRVTGATRRAAVPKGTVLVAKHSSPALSSILVPFLKLSNNAHAEALTKAIGRKKAGAGSWAAGTAAIRTWLAANGVAVGTLRTSDGSGLSRTDLVTANQTTNLLRAVRTKPWFRTWYAALPVAGRGDRLVGGTLRDRMTGTAAAGNVHAKTGSLTGVSALSGYVTDAGGRKLVFSIMFTDTVSAGVKSVEDRLAVALARSGGSGAAAAAPLGTTAGGSAQDGADVPQQRGPSVVDDPATAEDETQLECSWVGAC